MAVDSDRISDRRDELGLTNAAVARLVNQSPRYVENIMHGSDQPSRRVIYALARALNLHPTEVDPEIHAGKRTPQGDPSEPPIQPKNEPKSPPPRRGKKDSPGPHRVSDEAVVA